MSKLFTYKTLVIESSYAYFPFSNNDIKPLHIFILGYQFSESSSTARPPLHRLDEEYPIPPLGCATRRPIFPRAACHKYLLSLPTPRILPVTATGLRDLLGGADAPSSAMDIVTVGEDVVDIRQNVLTACALNDGVEGRCATVGP